MTCHQRKKLFINPELQGKLVRRTLFYWGAFLFLLVMPITLARTWQQPQQLIFSHLIETVFDYSSILLCATIVLPLAVYDMLKLSNRIAGPVFRLKREIGRMADGESIAPVNFRPDDHWHDLADEFNRLIHSRERPELMTQDFQHPQSCSSDPNCADIPAHV